MTRRVLLIDPVPDRAERVGCVLEREGFRVVARVGEGADLHERVTRVDPDIVIVDLDSPDDDLIEALQKINAETPRPIVLFAAAGDPETIRAAVRIGMSAYVVDGLRPERVGVVVEVGIARFREFRRLRAELVRAQASLQERKIVERAKGLLMQRQGLDEDTAYRTLRKMAMDRGMKLADLARRVVEMANLLD
ncbi:MAG: ANTAR domain-containing protein [Gammaproteobacteria bacterium]|nr:ANTAR domain-containing protein [Gammaproteobacteria bacterium]NIR82357.1 ANTAR domain-containing protein [Gammaproteobacteria bacterium]NIR91952.1 ANTAR domain-containing protein [Gammaproteobacteria bacterium]NIV76980.1 ANTAR domain-containing protein [Gammaproteobacteria bacterium]